MKRVAQKLAPPFRQTGGPARRQLSGYLRGTFGSRRLGSEEQFPGLLVNPGAVRQTAEPTLDEYRIDFVDQAHPSSPIGRTRFRVVSTGESSSPLVRGGLSHHDMSRPGRSITSVIETHVDAHQIAIDLDLQSGFLPSLSRRSIQERLLRMDPSGRRTISAPAGTWAFGSRPTRRPEALAP